MKVGGTGNARHCSNSSSRLTLKNSAVSETISKKHGTVIRFQFMILEQWVERLREQFDWSRNTLQLPATSQVI